MIIQNLNLFVEKLRKDFPKYEFKLNHQGSNWARVFVLFETVTLGRINFNPVDDGHEIYGWKHYKPVQYEYELRDDFFYQFSIWLHTGRILPIAPIVEQAKINRDIRLAEKQKWREEHPSKKRKPLNKSFMCEFRKLVFEEIKAVEGTVDTATGE